MQWYRVKKLQFQMTRKEIGEMGESAAVNLLIEKGYKLLERNYRVGHLELDIIAKNDDTIAFVEVKTCSANYLVSPQETVNYRKRYRIVNAANGYMRHFQRRENARLDVITVLHQYGKVVIVEQEDAFIPEVRTY